MAARVFAFAGLVCAPLLLIGACDNASLQGMNQPCYQSIDCQLGLACVPQPNDAGGICTNNLMGIVDVPEAGDGMIAYDAPPMVDSPVMDQVTPMDNYVPMDTGTGMDTGTPEDSGTD